MSSLLEVFTAIQFVYIIVGLVFTLGAGGVLFAFALSYISQKLAMWIDVIKIVNHRNALVEENKAVKIQIQTLESVARDTKASIISPTEIGVRTIDPSFSSES